jgi:hypothetical protein
MMTPLEEIRHSAAHILATAILRVFPEAKLDIGPPTETGFYYDIDLDHKLTADDLARIEAEMKKVIDENQPFRRSEVSREEATAIIQRIGQERYKLGRLADIPEGEAISFYTNGEFTDLCAGTHVRYTKQVKAFKLLSIAGAYHRGDEHNKQLQRIYGTAFASKDELAAYLTQQEQAKLRDHRKLGRELRLFHIDEDVGRDKRLVALGVLGAKRAAALPDVPTIAEQGVKGYELTNWFGLVVPAATPKNLIARIHDDFTRVLQEKEIRDKITGMGADAIGNTPEQFEKFWRNESEKWARVVKEANIKAN